jgi:hypothetical protein
MTKPKNLKVNPLSAFISSLDRLHNKSLSNQEINIYSKFIELSGLSDNYGLDPSLKEIAIKISTDEKLQKKSLKRCLQVGLLIVLAISLNVDSSKSYATLLKDVSLIYKDLFSLVYKYLFSYSMGKSHDDFASKIVFKLSDLLLEEDVRSILEIQIRCKLKDIESPLLKRVVVFNLFCDSLWGTRIIPYFQNKFLPSKKETDRY